MRWLTSTFVINEQNQKIIEEKFIKEDEPMSNLARIARSIYNDGKSEGKIEGEKFGEERGKIIGIAEGRISSLKRLLSYKLKINLNSECMNLIDNVPISKLDEIERKIFEITSWKEVEEILVN